MATPSDRAESTPWNLASGAALGLLLGMLIGLSATPVVSTVISALVALLAGLFGLGRGLGIAITASAAQRLTAFALAAALMVPCATWLRTHDVLGPTLAEQKQALRDIGYADDAPEHKALLRYLRYGIALPGSSSGPAQIPTQGVLYNEASGGFCDATARVETIDDLVSLSKQYGPATEETMHRVAALPEPAKRYAAAYTRIFLCSGTRR